jgi:hypothetical protein
MSRAEAWDYQLMANKQQFLLKKFLVTVLSSGLTSSSKYQLSNANGKEHLECVIHMDDIGLIAVDKIQNVAIHHEQHIWHRWQENHHARLKSSPEMICSGMAVCYRKSRRIRRPIRHHISSRFSVL